ncbi:MAG: YidH family protein [Isosphaeraceae bacterium]
MQPAGIESRPPFSGSTEANGPAPVDDPRVYLAAERTYLAWMRTSVALMGFGFLIARFAFWLREYTSLQTGTMPLPNHHRISPWMGFGMVVVGVFVSVTAALRHYQYIEALRRGNRNPALSLGGTLSIAVILALVGLAMAVQILMF